MSEYYHNFEAEQEQERCASTSSLTIFWMIGNALASIVLIIFLTCFQHGERCGDVRRRQRPRLVYPVNFLRNYDHRLAYLFSFIAMSGSVLQLFLRGAPKPGGLIDPIVKAFVSEILKYISICLVGLIFYPFPLCVSFDNIPMNVVGLVYTTNWLFFTISKFITCPFGTEEGNIQGAVDIPVVFSLIGLEIYFIRRIVRMCRRFLTADQCERQFEETHYCVRVRYLLLPATAWASRNKSGGAVTTLFRIIYPNIPGFKYSTRIVCTVGLALACMYQTCAYYVAALRPLLKEIDQHWLETLPATFYASCILAFVIAVTNSFFTLRNYRNHTRSLWKGDYSLTYIHQTPPRAVVSALKFSGYTIAFLISGFIILQVMLWAIFFGLSLLFQYGLLLELMREYWVHLAMIVFLYIALRIFARCVLLQANEDGALVLKNLHLFHIITFFFIFLSVLLGIAGCIFRILKAAVVGLVLIGRVDQCLLIRGFERFDRGYMAYRGYLTLEVSMTHPVLVTFCQLLCRSNNERKYRPEGECTTEMGDSAAPSPSRKRRIARNRWLVAYTLIRNPQLAYKIPLRVDNQNKSSVASEMKTSHLV
eukprot:XP_011661902.1 PREDICTED: stimulated by retinoic acid gene 6 protein homolog [Strongylocentrotus purpuratus]